MQKGSLIVSPKQFAALLILISLSIMLSGVALGQGDSEDVYRPVIVQLDVEFTPESQLSGGLEAVEEQRETIESAQDDLVGSLVSSGVDLQNVKSFDTIPYIAVTVSERDLIRLQNNPAVTGIFEDQLFVAFTSSANAVIGADEAQAAGLDGSGSVVAVLDTGVDFTHQSLTNRRVFEACFNSNTFVTFPGVSSPAISACPNGQDEQIGSNAARPYTGGASSVCPGCDHGTHVAGIVAGNDNLAGGFRGVAPKAGLIGVNVFTIFTDSAFCGAIAVTAAPCTLSFTSDQIRGMEYIYSLRDTYNITSLNFSLGSASTFSSVEECETTQSAAPFIAAVANLRSANIAVIAAAGNSSQRNEISQPACYSGIISVGATSDADVVASFSNDANYLDLFAPGVSITSTVPGGGMGTKSGTSMAAPYVSGTWAVVRQVFPFMSIDDVLGFLQSSGVPVTDQRDGPGNPGHTHSRIRLGSSLMASAAGYSGAEFTTVTYQDLTYWLQQQVNSNVRVILVVIRQGEMDIYAEANGYTGKVTVSLTSNEGILGFQFKQITDATNAQTPPQSYLDTIVVTLPEMLTSALDDLIEFRFGSVIEAEYGILNGAGLQMILQP
jgi:subtilisin family serine protease